MKFMTPQKYSQLIHRVFCKSRSLFRETEQWNRNQIVKEIIQATFYNCTIAEAMMLIVSLDHRISGVQFDLIFATLGVALGAILGIAFGIYGSYIMGVSIGLILSTAMGHALGGKGEVLSVASEIIFGLYAAVVLPTPLSAILGSEGIEVPNRIEIAIGLVGTFFLYDLRHNSFLLILFFLLYSRWFYLPYFLLPFVRNLKLQKLPYHWDENIRIPLPFLETTLFHVSKRNRAYVINECLFLIRERPPQRKAAQHALARIAISEMILIRDLRDIAYLHFTLHFLPEDKEAFPKFYSQGFEQINLFAKDAKTSLNEENPSNRLRMLERLAGNMQEFQKKMDFVPRKIGVPFGRIASRWLEIVQKEIKQIESNVGRPLPNPFIVGRPIDPESELFVGRRDIIEQIQQEALREGGAGAILFIGSRRTGKTSTLLNLKRYLLTSLRPVFVDCQSFSHVSYFARDITRSINLALGHEKEKVKQCNSLDELTEYLQLIQNDIRKNNLHLLLCFDEYERLTEKIVSGEFNGLPDAFRHWIQHLPRTICLFAGSHILNEIEAIDWTDYFINVRTVRISFLDFDSALRLVTEPIPKFDLQYESRIETAKKLVRRLGCQPFLLQATMSELVNHLNTLHRKTAAQADIDISIERLFDSQSTYFEHIWQTETSDREKEVLEAIIKQQPMPQESDPAIRSLIRKEVLQKEKNKMIFCVPVFKEWIVRKQVC